MSAVERNEGSAVRNWLIGLGLWVVGVAGCSQNNASLATANLLAVDDIALLCVESKSATRVYVERGRPLEECAESTYSERRLIALATQRETGEVAVLDATSCGFPSANAQTPCSATLLDVERTQPGLNFLPVGGEPVGIVSTPGGTASFVAVAEAGKTGIFGLPSTCIGVRQHQTGEEAQAVRDIRTWPACRLPVAPGTIAMFRDQSGKETRCDKLPDAVFETRECPADLGVEERRGRLKLAVTLPELGQLWTFDAQEILDRAPGAFSECVAETTITFGGERPTQLTQAIPVDLSTETKVYEVPQGSFISTPTDIAADINASHGQMYVADRTAPVIHQLDTRDACNVAEAGLLYPLSFTQPEAVVGTRKVAVSPVVDSGARYVYAVEESSQATAGSMMVFDVSPGATQRTPIVLNDSPFMQDQLPDRVGVGAEVSDVEFMFRDSEVIDDNGVTSSGIRCEPAPEGDDSAGALFRPTSSGEGAGPLKLRGLFAVASLYNGQLALVDVDDYDAPCRRPSVVGGGEGAIEVGCATDADEFAGSGTEVLNDAELTRVTDEKSCQVVQPHRVRARSLYTEGVGAPRLRALPRLRSEEGTSLLVDQSAIGLEHPRMLVPYGKPGRLVVGTSVYTTDGADGTKLEVDPQLNEGSNLLLPFEQPRSYSKHTGLGAITYEGILGSANQARVSLVKGAEYPRQEVARVADSTVYGVLDSGPGALLCSLGLEDVVTIGDRAEALQPTADAASVAMSAEEYRGQFASYYGDYVELLEPLLSDAHQYWDKGGEACGEKYRGDAIDGRRACELTFGVNAEGQPERNFRIVRAFDDQLLVEPRNYGSDKERTALLEMLGCCFPDATWYVPRSSHHWVYREASTLSHPIDVGDGGACVRSDESYRSRLGFRAFEVSCAGEACDGVGPVSDAEVPVCVLNSTNSEALAALPSACLYEGLAAQFAVYRGAESSSRGMEFSWSISGGFSPFLIPMTSFGSAKQSVPQRLRFIPQVGRLAVTDGGAPSGRDNRPMGFVLLGFENAAGAPDVTYSAVNYYYY
jgi:hypothetical protein